MDAILAEVYSTVLPAAPYVIGAYVGIWIVLAVYTLMLSRRSKQTVRDLDAAAAFALEHARDGMRPVAPAALVDTWRDTISKAVSAHA